MARIAGTRTFSGRARQLTASAPMSTPAPTIAPTNAWVVDTGRRAAVAKVTHATVPSNTAKVNSGVGVAVKIPFENSFVSSAAKVSDTSPPRNVVTVPHTIAVR